MIRFSNLMLSYLYSFSGEQDVLYSVFSQLQNQLFQFRWTRPLYTVFINQPRLVVTTMPLNQSDAHQRGSNPLCPFRPAMHGGFRGSHWGAQRDTFFCITTITLNFPPSSQASCLLKIDGCPWGCCCCCVDRPLMDLFFHDLHTNILTTEFNGNLPGSPSQEETLSISGKLVTESKNWIYDRFWI